MRRATVFIAHACASIANFNPRTPCGGRRNSILALAAPTEFQSTPSMRRATRRKGGRISLEQGISIHTLHAEGDPSIDNENDSEEAFQSTPSMRRATGDKVLKLADKLISIHALHAEGDHGDF